MTQIKGKITVVGLNKIEPIRRVFACEVSVNNVADKIKELIDAINILIRLEEERLNNTFDVLKEQNDDFRL